ncbi:hypothetical protein EBU71_13830 [bacterium]|nr:hypothetical protein [Candidatus Elulimicrobium humile]
MIFHPVRFITLLVCFLFWIFVVGCANTTYQTIPNAMSEDAQDYPTKYNMMDSPDGSGNPNAQINLLKFKY